VIHDLEVTNEGVLTLARFHVAHPYLWYRLIYPPNETLLVHED
jgi:hypothetical protein